MRVWKSEMMLVARECVKILMMHANENRNEIVRESERPTTQRKGWTWKKWRSVAWGIKRSDDREKMKKSFFALLSSTPLHFLSLPQFLIPLLSYFHTLHFSYTALTRTSHFVLPSNIPKSHNYFAPLLSPPLLSPLFKKIHARIDTPIFISLRCTSLTSHPFPGYRLASCYPFSSYTNTKTRVISQLSCLLHWLALNIRLSLCSQSSRAKSKPN